MPDGYKIGDGYVEVRAVKDQASSKAVGEEITADVQRDVGAQAPVIGKKLGEGVRKGVEDDVRTGAPATAAKLGKSFEDALIPKITGVGGKAGAELSKGLDSGFDDQARQSQKIAAALGTNLFPKIHKIGSDAGDELGKALDAGAANEFRTFGAKIGAQLIPQAKAAGRKAATGAVEDISEVVDAAVSKWGKLGAVLGPLIVAGIATAVTLGIGAIGVGLGYELVKDNAQVKAAAAQMKHDVGVELKDSAKPLVGAFADAFLQLDADMAAEKSQFDAFFEALAPSAAPLETDLDNIVHDLMPALVNAAHAFTDIMSSPAVTGAVNAIAEGLAFFINQIADNKELVEGFFVFLAVTIGGIFVSLGLVTDAIGGLIDLAGWLGDEFVKMAEVPDFGKDFGKNITEGGTAAASTLHNLSYEMRAYAEEIGGANDQYQRFLPVGEAVGAMIANGTAPLIKKLTTDWQGLTDAVQATVATQETYVEAIVDKQLGAIMDADRATLSWAESLTALHKAMQLNGKDININHAKGQQNREAILASVQANIKLYDTMIQTGASALDAADAYDKNQAALRRQLKAAGLTKAQIDGLIGSYDKVPDQVNTDMAVAGLVQAISGLIQVDTLLADLNGSLTVFSIQAKIQALQIGSGAGGDQGASGRSTRGQHYPIYGPPVPKPKTPPPAGANQSPPPPPKKPPPPKIDPRAQRFGGVNYAALGLVGLDQAAMYQAGNSPLFGFAEPGTEEEGFVPKNGLPGRSVPLIEQEASWYGRHLAAPGADAGQHAVAVQSGGKTYYVTINLNGPWMALDPKLPRKVVAMIFDELKRYEKSVT